jgi:hypothetical protein
MNHAEVVSGNFFLIWPTQRQYRGEIHISSCFGKLRLMLIYPHNSHLSHTATPHINTNFMINSTTLYYMHRKACGQHRYAAHHDKLHMINSTSLYYFHRQLCGDPIKLLHCWSNQSTSFTLGIYTHDPYLDVQHTIIDIRCNST